MSSDHNVDLNEYFRESPYNEWIDISVETTGNDRSVVTVPYHEKLTNPGETIHGGVLASLVDVAGGAAVMNALEDTDVFLATTDMDIRYLDPASTAIEAIGRVKRVGSSMCVAAVDIRERDTPESEDVAFGSVAFKPIE